jgi:hypothetical protein
MSPNSSTVKKLLLTAGLLLVLGQGLWHLPQLQDYLFPADQEKSLLQQAGRTCSQIETDLRTLNERLDYLKWFQAHNGPEQRLSMDRLRVFPFSEAIRPLAPRFFWDTNIRLAHKNRLRVERKLQYLEGLLKNPDKNPPVKRSQAGPAMPSKTAAVSSLMKQILQFHDQYRHYHAKLRELTEQLAWLEDHGYKQ